MTKPEKKRIQFLVLLLVILAVTLAVGYRAHRPDATPNTPAGVETKPATTLPVTSDARIRLDLLSPSKAPADLGKVNVFQYRTRAIELAGSNGTKSGGIAAAPPPPPPPPPRVGPVIPPGPPPPPPIALKYVGFIHSGKSLTAVLADNSQHVFNAVEGDFVMGRYRLVRITETAVEVEDTEYNRHQTLALEKQ